MHHLQNFDFSFKVTSPYLSILTSLSGSMEGWREESRGLRSPFGTESVCCAPFEGLRPLVDGFMLVILSEFILSKVRGLVERSRCHAKSGSEY